MAAKHSTSHRKHIKGAVFYPFLTGFFAFVGILPHLGPWTNWGDAAEFTVVATVGGIAHPTGYPLYGILGMLFTKMMQPLGEIIAPIVPELYGLTLLSALSIAAAGAALCVCIQILGAALAGQSREFPNLFGMTGMAGGLSFAWGETAFELATTVEVYALQAFLEIALIALSLRIAAAPKQGSRLLFAASFLSGLSLCHHRMSLFACAALAAAALIWLYYQIKAGTGSKKIIGCLTGCVTLCILGLTPIAYLPIRASANPPMNWGAPDTPERLNWTLRGGEFLQFRLLQVQPGTDFTWETFSPFAAQRAKRIIRWTGEQTIPIPDEDIYVQRTLRYSFVGLFCIGAIALLWGAPRLAFVLAPWILGHAILPFLYNIYDIEGYLLLLWPGIFIIALIGLGATWRLTEILFLSRPLHFFPLLFLALPLATYWVQMPRTYMQPRLGDHPIKLYPPGHDPLPERWASRVLRELSPNAVILTEGDNDFFPLHYVQRVHEKRPDVTIVGSNFLKEEWYGRWFPAFPEATLQPDQAPDQTEEKPTNPLPPPYIPATGGGTPTSAEAFYKRVALQAIFPAWAQGRDVYWVIGQESSLEYVEKLGEVTEIRKLVDKTEEERYPYILAPPPATLYKIDPPKRLE